MIFENLRRTFWLAPRGKFVIAGGGTADTLRYCRMRGSMEATNAMLKRVTGLDRLRVRGRPAVFSGILLKVAGWDLLRAASVRSLINKLSKGGGGQGRLH